MTEPQDIATRIESRPQLPHGEMERFIGYGVMAQPFESGHILALRRFVATSIGPGYTSVWHRDPAGRWVFYTTAEPLQSCNRYFGSDVSETRRCDIALDWSGPRTLTVSTSESTLRWDISLAATASTRALNASGKLIPDAMWQNRRVLAMMGKLAGGSLQSGRMLLHGAVPNGQKFLANPRLVWTVTSTSATVEGKDLGSPGPLRVQDRLADFWLPQRGLFFTGAALFEPFSADRHRLVADRSSM